MGYIPKHAKWYLAEIIEEIKVTGEQETLVHINTVLVRADTPEEAYDKAIELGKEREISYENTDGQLVNCVFRGLFDLNVIHEELEHGAELAYREHLGLTEEQMSALVLSKEQLSVFLPISPASGPNIASREVMKAVETMLITSQEADRS